MGTDALLTDLYELTMAASYLAEGMTGSATFDLFVRDLPQDRSFLIACGLEQALDYLAELSFDQNQIEFLRSLEIFDSAFLQFLAKMRFTGEVWAVPEGEVIFSGEPILRVTAPLIEAQIIETFMINSIGFSTSVATKAARVSIACAGREFVDFSARRDHGADAAVMAARAAFIGGASATSNVLAGTRFGIPLSGTMAHSYVMAFDDEKEAFRAFARAFPSRAIFLIDTFDTIAGARIAAQVANELHLEGIDVQGVRIDSGDLAELSKQVRKILDDAGQNNMSVFASGDLDEFRIEALLKSGAAIDGFGVGTQLGTSGDAPALGIVYKLAEYEGGPKLKRSIGKETTPGLKQVYRFERDGRYAWDQIEPARTAPPEEGRKLLGQVMKYGQRTTAALPLEAIRESCRQSISKLPEPLRTLRGTADYRVSTSTSLLPA